MGNENSQQVGLEQAVARPGAFLGQLSSEVRSVAARLCPSPGRLLDVGCGNGLLFAELPAGGTLHGADTDMQLLQEGQKILAGRDLGPTAFTIADASSLPYRNDTFDNILLLNTLMNIPDDSIVVGFMQELARVLRPGGRIILDVRNNANWVMKIRYWLHNMGADFIVRGYDMRHLQEMFQSCGCNIEGSHPVGPWMPFGPSGYVVEATKTGSN